ncbi:MAG: hypothetical protein ACYC91_17715 [Solirubrobacteraceae bacterium]
MELSTALNRRELQRYVHRVGDRWPIEIALLGGARVADQHGAPPQRERGPGFVIMLVSSAYDGMPWLERVYQAGSLWDALERGAPADIHCYTPAEFERKRWTLRSVQAGRRSRDGSAGRAVGRPDGMASRATSGGNDG